MQTKLHSYAALAAVALVLAGCATAPEKSLVAREVLLSRYGAEIVKLTVENQNGQWFEFHGRNGGRSPVCMALKVENYGPREAFDPHASGKLVAAGGEVNLGWWEAPTTRTVRYGIWQPEPDGRCRAP